MRILSSNNSVGAAVSILTLLCVLLLAGVSVSAQSTEIENPSPVQSNQLAGTILALDIGDARLTRHFYTLMGTPGDLSVTVESQDLNGDVDVFVARTLRPVMKISMFATGGSSGATRTVFLHLREPLILRVEARSAGDAAGTYQIRFGGSFEPIVGLASDAGTQPPATAPGGTASTSSGRRVSSVGARIPEPVREPAPEPTPSSAGATSAANEPAAQPDAPKANEGTTSTARPGKPAPKSGLEIRRAPSPRPVRSRPPARGSARPKPPEENASGPPTAAQELPPAPSSRLIIELKDGNRIEQPMTAVRRVTIDNGLIVILHVGGRIERIPMSGVARIAIEP
jgi:pyruvate/2-oxoglutarate dehydrogenase complex dihydrolipoamide acyltransferase (E2) component